MSFFGVIDVTVCDTLLCWHLWEIDRGDAQRASHFHPRNNSRYLCRRATVARYPLHMPEPLQTPTGSPPARYFC